MHYVTIGEGVRLSYDRMGSGPDVVLIHGLGANKYSWPSAIMRPMSPSFRVTTYDLRGHGESDMPSAGYTSADMARDLSDLMDATKIEHAHIVGHSLGGVLSKQLLQRSGRRIEQGLLTRPLNEVAMSPETRATLSRLLYFEPEPSIRRAVFICAPHRGSNTANQLAGRLSSTLVRRLGDVDALHEEIIALNGPEVFQPAYRRRPPNSIDNLTWESPILKALSELPIAPDVPYHSIVANLFPDGSPGLWTDGVVSYESAHLDGSESEIMVRHNHFANDTPEAATEVRRILRLHLGAAR